MATKVAPTHATLTIEYLEQTLYNKITAEFGQPFREEFEKVWKQF